MTERPWTGTCDIAAVRSPSLSLVFYKEKRDKVLKAEFLFFVVLNLKRRNCCVDSYSTGSCTSTFSTSSHQAFIMLGQKRQLFQKCLICTFPNSKSVTGTAKNCLVFHLNDKKNKRYRDFKIKHYIKSLHYYFC